MAHRRKSLSRVLTATLATGLVSLISTLVLSPAAFARVTIVPGTVDGGGTETFAVRLANERSDEPTTRLELILPTDVVVPFVDVAPVRGWTATVEMRPLDPPVTVGDQEIDEAPASIVWEGGEVGPRQFEQFLVTAGPLPSDGRLVFGAVQGYADGSADRWTDPAEPGAAGAPTIVLLPPPAPPAGEQAAAAAAPVGAGPATTTPAAAEQTDMTLLWASIACGALVLILAGVAGYRARPTPNGAKSGAAVEPSPEQADRR